MTAGETVLRRGCLLTSRETGVLAAIGVPHVNVWKKPAPAVLDISLSDGPQFVNIQMGIMSTKRTHIVISEQLATAIDRVVGKRGRSSFLAQAAERELLRLRQIKALEGASGDWKDKDHPELKEGAAAWVKKIRRENERRSSKLTH
jgi:hypothetical protein